MALPSIITAPADTDLTGEVDEVAVTPSAAGDLARRGGSGQAGLVGDAQSCSELAGQREQGCDVHLLPAEVGCQHQPAGCTGHDPGKCQTRTDDTHAGRDGREHVATDAAQVTEDGRRIAAGVVTVHPCRGHDVPGDVQDPGREIAGIGLEAQRRDPVAGDEWSTGSPGARLARGFELAQQLPRDQLIDQAGDGRPGQ